MSTVNQYAKAVVGAIIAGAGSLQVALADDVVTKTEWVQVASAFVVALGLVWGVQNAPAPAPLEPSVPEDSLPDAVL